MEDSCGGPGIAIGSHVAVPPGLVDLLRYPLMSNLIKIGIPLGLKYTRFPKKSTKNRGLSDHSNRSSNINMYQAPAPAAAEVEINLGDIDDLRYQIFRYRNFET